MTSILQTQQQSATSANLPEPVNTSLLPKKETPTKKRKIVTDANDELPKKVKTMKPTSSASAPLPTMSNPSRSVDSFVWSNQKQQLSLKVIDSIMKRALPSGTRVGHEAKRTLMKCVCEFISFVTDEAADRTQFRTDPCINSTHLIDALHQLGFSGYGGYCAEFSHRFQEHLGASSQQS